MYEDPVLVDSVYEFNGKKVGYLAYAGFDQISAGKLIEVSKKFKAKGIKEIILDLRYNGGGFVSTEELLGSLIAPKTVVKGNEIFHTSIYNQGYMDYYKENKRDLNTYFGMKHTITTDGKDSKEVDITDANMDLTKVYAIITSGSASASEGVLVALNPYMEIDLIGEQSHGKYCTGWMLSPKDVYKNPSEIINNWGIYVMVATFADKNGENISRPNGLTPNFKVEDDPIDGYQLGDVRESMLAAALKRAGKEDAVERVMTRSANERLQFKEIPFHYSKTFGMSIVKPSSELLIKR
jgi:C-terminal processing protease CtpA/Prc